MIKPIVTPHITGIFNDRVTPGAVQSLAFRFSRESRLETQLGLMARVAADGRYEFALFNPAPGLTFEQARFSVKEARRKIGGLRAYPVTEDAMFGPFDEGQANDFVAIVLNAAARLHFAAEGRISVNALRKSLKATGRPTAAP